MGTTGTRKTRKTIGTRETERNHKNHRKYMQEPQEQGEPQEPTRGTTRLFIIIYTMLCTCIYSVPTHLLNHVLTVHISWGRKPSNNQKSRLTQAYSSKHTVVRIHVCTCVLPTCVIRLTCIIRLNTISHHLKKCICQCTLSWWRS